MSIRKVAWVFASAAVLIGIGSLIWSSRGTILISEVVASCREDATRVCASEVAEGGGSGIDLEDITRYDGGSTSDATRETNRMIIVDCLRRHEHLLHHICRYNLVSYDNSRDDKYSHTREHQRQYIVPIIVCMYSLIPTAVLIYSLYMTVRIHQLQSTAIRLNRGNRGSEAEDGQGCSADTATIATDASCNNRIETIGFHNVDCVQGGILFELMAGTMNVIIKHDDGEGGAAAVRVLSQLAGRAIEIGSSAVVHTVNSRLMSSSDYHYVRECDKCLLDVSFTFTSCPVLSTGHVQPAWLSMDASRRLQASVGMRSHSVADDCTLCSAGGFWLFCESERGIVSGLSTDG